MDKVKKEFSPKKRSKNSSKGFNKKPRREIKQEAHDQKLVETGDVVDVKPNDRKFDHKTKKLRTIRRKQKENKNYDLSVKLKTIWEEARRENCEENQRKELISQLVKMMAGNVKSLVYAHDTVRVIETVLRFGSEAQRQQLFVEVKDDVIEMSKSKYAKFFLIKLLQYGSKELKHNIIKPFYGRVKKLLRHSHASQVLEKAYNEVANYRERNQMVQEYYGAEFAFLQSEDTAHFGEILNKISPSQKEKILNQFKEELLILIEKNLVKHSIVHFLLRQFLLHANQTDKNELIDLLKEQVVEILHTKDGSRVAMECIWNGTAKDRKMILKSFKTHVGKIATEEFGHFVLLAAFDSVDDTILIEKTIINELVAPINALTIATNKFGIKVLEYLLSPRNTKFFHPKYIQVLARGDNNPHSKKDRNIREAELRKTASVHLLKLVETHVEDLLQEGSTSLLVLNILTMSSSEADKKPTLIALIKVIEKAGAYFEPKNDQMHFIENGHTNYLLKRLLVYEKNQVDNSKDLAFSQLLADTISKDVFLSWSLCNRGAFLLLDLLEAGTPSSVDKLKSLIDSFKKIIKSHKSKGLEMLIGKLIKIK